MPLVTHYKQLIQLVRDFYVFKNVFNVFLVYYAAYSVYSPPMGVETDR